MDTFGFEEFEKTLSNIINETPKMIEDFLCEVADETIAETQLNTPVVTGNLRRSWTRSDVKREGNDFNIGVGSNLEYAPHVEYGHKIGKSGFVKGQFILTNNVEKAKKNFDKKLMEYIERMTGGLKL
jgi:hypothetical protein